MGQYRRNDFSLGWMPSADAFNGPKNAMLRADNLVLDELGALALRQGSLKVNSTAFTDLDIHSLFTTTLSGSRIRMTGATDAVYANGTSIASSLAGSGDVSFGAHMGQILFARSTSKKKYDGSTVRTWGIAAPAAAPTLTVLSADSKVFSSCASTESPAMTSNEGTQAFANDRSATANAAVQISPDSTTGRGMSTKTFGGATDFTVYDAAQVGTDEDLIDFYAKVAEPQYITSITLMIDVNDGTFQQDWYEKSLTPGDAVDVVNTSQESLNSVYTVEGFDRQSLAASIEERDPVETSFLENAGGWNHFSVARGSMERHGLTAGKNWSTVLAVRVIVNAIAGGSGAAVTFDEIQIIGGAARPLTGKFKAAIVAVRNDGTYQAKSAPSAFSSEIEVKAQGIRATIDSGTIAALDSQVTELWLFLMGGRLNAFYRFTVKTGGPFSGAQTIDATSSEITALIAKIRLETNNATPPDSIIGIEGPHFDRTLCLTANYIYPSRQLNPDSYSAGEVVRVGDATETALWIKRLSESSLFVGTTRDVYRFDGDWTVQPDGSLNVVKRPMHVSSPPISAAVSEGNVNGVETLIYLTGAGWVVLGFGSLVNNAVDLLWRGYGRHGVQRVNITDLASRFRCAVSKNVLFAITPEGSDTTSSSVIHAYHFGKQRWYRYTYPQAFRSIYTEYDGTLIAGDASGFVRTLDIPTKQDDGANIPIVLWTGVDDNAEPFTYKDAENLWMRADTAGDTASIAVHLNGDDAAGFSTSIAQEGTSVAANQNIAGCPEFSSLQFRITGSFHTFLFRGWELRYLDNPIPQVIHDTGFVDLSQDALKWISRIRIKAKSPVNMTVQPYWDGEMATQRTAYVVGYVGQASTFEVPLGRLDRAKVGRVVVTTSEPSHVYWIEFVFNGTGRQLQKRFTFQPEAA